MKAQYYVKLEDFSGKTWFVGPFASPGEARDARHAEPGDDRGFVTRGVMTKTEARSHGLRPCTLLGGRMPEDKADFAELCAYAWQLA